MILTSAMQSLTRKRRRGLELLKRAQLPQLLPWRYVQHTLRRLGARWALAVHHASARTRPTPRALRVAQDSERKNVYVDPARKRREAALRRIKAAKNALAKKQERQQRILAGEEPSDSGSASGSDEEADEDEQRAASGARPKKRTALRASSLAKREATEAMMERDAQEAAAKPASKPKAEVVKPTQAELLLEAAETTLISLRSLDKMMREAKSGGPDKANPSRLRSKAFSDARVIYRSRRGAGDTYTFTGVEDFPPVINARAPAGVPEARRLCAITGQRAKYKDPHTGWGYADATAFAELRAALAAGTIEPLPGTPAAADLQAARAASPETATSGALAKLAYPVWAPKAARRVLAAGPGSPLPPIGAAQKPGSAKPTAGARKAGADDDDDEYIDPSAGASAATSTPAKGRRSSAASAAGKKRARADSVASQPVRSSGRRRKSRSDSLYEEFVEQ